MSAILAGGTVVLRRTARRTEVAVIHRPRYDDWTLPKGKLETGRESLPGCAVRETLEESGLLVRLDVPLDTVSYKLHGDRKIVHYWRATVVGDRGLGRHNREVDKIRWIDADGGLSRLNFSRDRKAVRQAMALPPTTAVAIARHGKALTRKRWKGGPDVERPLVRRGFQQARDLVDPLAAYGITDLRSSAGTRCVQTFEPAAKEFDRPLVTYDLFTEETGIPRPDEVAVLMGAIGRRASYTGEPVAVCGHRPVLPAMFTGLGVAPRPMGTGDVVVAHLTGHAGTPVAVEHHSARH